jgi:DNA-binding transcriptional ArsR family regulator
VTIVWCLYKETGEVSYNITSFLLEFAICRLFLRQVNLEKNTQLFRGHPTALNSNKILRSSCRRKILKALSEKKEITIMKLVRSVNSTYNEVNRNLQILERHGIVTQQQVGRKRIIRLNLKNEQTVVSLKILKILETSVDLKQLHRNLKRVIENTKEYDNNTKL